MRVELRETGSIVLPAAKAEVLELLQASVQGAAFVSPDRLEGDGSVYVLRELAAGTQVIHARTGSASVPRATRDRAQLRRTVESDLFRLQRLFDVRSN